MSHSPKDKQSVICVHNEVRTDHVAGWLAFYATPLINIHNALIYVCTKKHYLKCIQLD